jgi:sulfur relay (sulfurtransferase) complex TusBCD TusD component (DsrE family)
MSRYLLIESRDPFESRDTERWGELAARLVREGHSVTLFLVQDGVFLARVGAHAGALAGATSAGITVLADDFSLRERGIVGTRLTAGVAPTPLDVVVEHMEQGGKTLWH